MTYAENELQGKTLTIYVDPTSAPFSFLETDITKPQGIDVDLIYELKKRLGFELTEDRIFVLCRADQLSRITSKKADLIGGGLSYTDERAKIMDFTTPYFYTGMSILYSTKYHPEIKSLDDLEGKSVIVQPGTTIEAFVKSNLPNSKTVTVNNIISGYFLVAQGKADAVIYDRPVIENFANTTKDTLSLAVTNDLFNQSECVFTFALDKGSPYKEIINKSMEEMRNDGTFNRIIEKWLLK